MCCATWAASAICWRSGDVPLNGNAVQRMRYYDRNTGVLAPLPESVTVFRYDCLGKAIGAVRHESDNPQVVAFFTRREPGRNSYCEETPSSASRRPAAAAVRQARTRAVARWRTQLCIEGNRDSRVDGARHFRAPLRIHHGAQQHAVRRHLRQTQATCRAYLLRRSSSRGLADASGVTYARRFDGPGNHRWRPGFPGGAGPCPCLAPQARRCRQRKYRNSCRPISSVARHWRRSTWASRWRA